MEALRKVSLKEAVRILRSGGLAVYPTDTAYGLAADSRDRGAVEAIYAGKGRERRKPLAMIAASEEMVRRHFRLEGAAAGLARKHWPGPLTLILPIRDAKMRRALGLAEGGVRVPASRMARELSAGVGAPIVSTSANRSGGGQRYSPRTAVASLGADVPVLDGGVLPRRAPSTVVAFRRGKPVVLRQGAIRVA